MNYELIYKMRRHNTMTLKNIEIGLVNEAREKAATIHKKYTDALEKALGHSNFEVTNILCCADGIMGHVYAHPQGHHVEKGLGKRKCVFCGCDDWDD